MTTAREKLEETRNGARDVPARSTSVPAGRTARMVRASIALFSSIIAGDELRSLYLMCRVRTSVRCRSEWHARKTEERSAGRPGPQHVRTGRPHCKNGSSIDSRVFVNHCRRRAQEPLLDVPRPNLGKMPQ